MLFSSLVFLTIFLPLVLGLYSLARVELRNGVLLVGSIVFYTWGSGVFVLLLLAIGVIAWALGNEIARRRRDGRDIRIIMTVGVAAVLGPLLFFKYARFFSENLASLFDQIGVDLPVLAERELPIGISFFTFQALSYLFDVARSDAQAQRRVADFVLYLALFPQLIAGPIVRYSTIASELNDRRFTGEGVSAGLQRFTHGLAKKIIVADAAGAVASSVFGEGDPSTIAAWIGALAYAIQIYFDFSGYSDMAIGLGLIFGFHFPTNFFRPYSAYSITDFWRRWHITLSDWFRDYVYIPLGGNRRSSGRAYLNLIVVFFLTALWHGAAWTFLAWGGLHAAVLVIERVSGTNHTRTAPRPGLSRARTALLVVVLWVFFRAEQFDDAIAMLTSMFTWSGADLHPELVAALTFRNALTIALASAVFLLPRTFDGFAAWHRPSSAIASAARPVAVAATMGASMALITSGSLSPFLYFQF